MAQIDARGHIFQIESDTPDTWLTIEATTKYSVDRSEGEETAETTTFEDNGVQRSQAMQRGAKLELTCKLSRDQDGVQAPGQKRCETLARLVGDASTGHKFRWRHVLEGAWEQWPVWVSVGEASGEINDKAEWNVTIYRDGAPTFPDVA